ncbi:hypothetical protein CEXT_172301 [Caerostris extrusa]|uniref:Uncharacterized protein n=1 Tax=Caerostris extrusa TaxID=172846 RepID=A0AAV4MNN4_CAEEX|nr:hypothetical protein CEXT_172301 [Caerostris extrusa]
MPSENASRLGIPIANDFHRFLGPKEINRSMKDSWILQKTTSCREIQFYIRGENTSRSGILPANDFHRFLGAKRAQQVNERFMDPTEKILCDKV